MRRDTVYAAALATAISGVGCSDDERVSSDGTMTPPEPASSEWGSFGGDPTNSRSNELENVLTRDSVGTLTRAWESAAPGSTSTPAVVDGIVYWGDSKGTLHANRLVDGSEVWAEAIASGFSASPLVAGGRVYLGDSSGVVHARDAASGAPAWEANIANYAADDVEIAGLSLSISTNLFGSPSIVGDTIVIGTASAPFTPTQAFRGNVVGIDSATGTEKWRFDVTEHEGTIYGVGVSVWSSPAVDESRSTIYIGTGQSYAEPASPLSDALLAIDADSGELVWSRQFTPNDFYTFEVLVAAGMQGEDYDVGAAPTLFEVSGRAAVGVGDKSGMFYALDRDSGDLIWGRELTPGSALGGVMTAAAFHDGVIFVGSNTWTNFGGNLSLTDIPFDAPENTCGVFALDVNDDGNTRWNIEFESVCIGGVAHAAGVVYIGTANGTVHAIDAKTGEEVWSDLAGPDGIASGTSVSGGHLLVTHGWAFAIGVDSPILDGGLVAYAPSE